MAAAQDNEIATASDVAKTDTIDNDVDRQAASRPLVWLSSVVLWSESDFRMMSLIIVLAGR